MLFYSFGSAVGAAGTTAVYSAAGWAGSSLLGAAFALRALIIWAFSRDAAADARARSKVRVGATVRAGGRTACFRSRT